VPHYDLVSPSGVIRVVDGKVSLSNSVRTRADWKTYEGGNVAQFVAALEAYLGNLTTK
jgi:hypothetical protein